MSTSTVNTIVAQVITDVGSILATSLPVIVGLFGILLGLGLAIFYVRKFIARRK